MKETIYISCDIEANGPIPADNSMLSFGAAAFKSDGTLVSTFTANLDELPGTSPDEDTMEWWSKNEDAYLKTRLDTQDPRKAMHNFVSWVNNLNCKPIFVAYPAGFDFTYLYWYMMHFVGKSPFSFSALDIKSYVSAVLKKDYRECSKKNMPKRWFPENKHTHVSLDDAIEQGKLFINIMKEHISS